MPHDHVVAYYNTAQAGAKLSIESCTSGQVGCEIYEAVLDHGVRTPDEFTRYLERGSS
jgi:hypothetical protein